MPHSPWRIEQTANEEYASREVWLDQVSRVSGCLGQANSGKFKPLVLVQAKGGRNFGSESLAHAKGGSFRPAWLVQAIVNEGKFRPLGLVQATGGKFRTECLVQANGGKFRPLRLVQAKGGRCRPECLVQADGPLSRTCANKASLRSRTRSVASLIQPIWVSAGQKKSGELGQLLDEKKWSKMW